MHEKRNLTDKNNYKWLTTGQISVTNIKKKNLWQIYFSLNLILLNVVLINPPSLPEPECVIINQPSLLKGALKSNWETI